MMSFHASQLYSRNVLSLLQHLAPGGELALDFSDEITAGACVAGKPEAPAAPEPTPVAPDAPEEESA
jgi:NAD(P) transhydrogenase subunit alpha